MGNLIKIGFCVSYDWYLLKKSIPPVYKYADLICLALDKGRRSWAGNRYNFDEAAFEQFVKEIDPDNKVVVYEDDFSLPKLNARENCNRHRMMIAERMGKGGWHLQIDSDEYFIDFKGFVRDLKKIYKNPNGYERPLNVCGCWIPLVKKVDRGYIYADYLPGKPELVPVATNVPKYERARHNGYFNIVKPYFIIHETWARGKEEMLFKAANWGHSAEELKKRESREKYLKKWNDLDRNNYLKAKDFHPLVGEIWPRLSFVEAETIDELMAAFAGKRFPLSGFEIFMRNNRNIARIKSMLKKIQHNNR